MSAELKFEVFHLPHPNAATLFWEREHLIDWIGGKIYGLDGSITNTGVHWAYRFDCVTSSPNGEWSVLYERLGTKGIIFRHGQFVREINRSFYCAEAYEYPVVLFKLPNGCDVIAHCPEEYCKIEIEELESGKRLTQRSNKPRDFFHSRLTIDPTGTKLMSAGWMWHPFDHIGIYDIAEVLGSPSILDDEDVLSRKVSEVEINNACLLTQNSETAKDHALVVFASSPEAEDFSDEDEPKDGKLIPGTIGIFDSENGECLSIAPFKERTGTLMAIDDRHVISFYEHPKLINAFTGEVLLRWEDVKSGQQNSSILAGAKSPIPPISVDPVNRRFAVADKEKITAIQFR